MDAATNQSGACRRCARWEREVESLRSRVEELEGKLAEAERASNRQAGRFRRDASRKKTPGERKKPGRKAGPAAAHRDPPKKVDRTIDVPIECCPDCHARLIDKQVHEQYQVDIPPVVTTTTLFKIESGQCPCCGKRVQGRHMEQTSDAVGAAGTQFGPRIMGLGIDLKYRLGVPFRKVSDFFGKLIDGDFQLAPATLCRFAQRLADKTAPIFASLLRRLRGESIVGADATGWRIGDTSAGLWVFTSPSTTIYAIRRSLGHEVIEELLANFDGALMCDGANVFDATDYFLLRCNAHPLRRITKLLETAVGRDRWYLEQLQALWREALHLGQRRETLSERGYQRRATEMINRFHAWLDFHGRQPGEELARLARHLNQHRHAWLAHLYFPEFPTTNNDTERILKPAILGRKIGACNKTDRGAETYSRLLSLLITLDQRGKDFLTLVTRVLRSPDPRSIPLQTLPGG
jgi:transposase